MKMRSTESEKEKLLGVIDWRNDTYKELRPMLKSTMNALAYFDEKDLVTARKEIVNILSRIGVIDKPHSVHAIEPGLAKEVKRLIENIYRNRSDVFFGKDLDGVVFWRMSETIERARRRRNEIRKNRNKGAKNSKQSNLSQKAKTKLLELQKNFGFHSDSEAIISAANFYIENSRKRTKSSVKEKGGDERWSKLKGSIKEVKSMGKYPWGSREV